MTQIARIGLAVALAAFTAGCATAPPANPSAVVTSRGTKLITAERVKGAVVIGKSTKADVMAALGEAIAISFDHGYEVWLYRLADDARADARKPQRASGGEFVILFAPSGRAAKTRIRPAPPRERSGRS